MEDLSHYNPEGSDMRRAQMRMLEMLDVFDAICRKHNIKYWLDWGTLLGAKRHGGFIPWDDDLDLSILRSDYKKLLSVLKEELPENLKLQTRETDKTYFRYHPKIRDTKSVYHDKNGVVYEYRGIFFDIFLIEPVPSMRFKYVIDRFLMSGYRFKRQRLRFKKNRTLSHKIMHAIMSCFIPFIHVIIWLVRLYYKYIGRSKVYAYAFGQANNARYYLEDIFPIDEIMFEGKKFMAPHNVDKYLTNEFGPNYMEIPNVSRRYSHSLKMEFLQ